MNIVGGASAASPYSTLALIGGHLMGAWMRVRCALVGAVAVGLFLGALYFLFYLIRLSRLDRNEREFKQQQHHLETETLLRYVILIFCLLLLNVLFYAFFDFGKESIHTGILLWLVYGCCKLTAKYWQTGKAKKAC